MRVTVSRPYKVYTHNLLTVTYNVRFFLDTLYYYKNYFDYKNYQKLLEKIIM